MPYIFLSYQLASTLSGYGNGDRIEITAVRSIARGDTSNNSVIKLPGHYGTHIDFPKHFLDAGKVVGDYQASDFIFNHVAFTDISTIVPTDFLLKPEHFIQLKSDDTVELLIIKSGFCHQRYSEDYWLKNWGFAPESAAFFRSLYPNLRAVMFDLMSLTSYQQREIGRVAHRAFLGDEDLLIIEDVDLTHVTENTHWNQVIVAPLRFENSDGSPVTIIARIDE